jgi:lysophospholipase L1-like esterase
MHSTFIIESGGKMTTGNVYWDSGLMQMNDVTPSILAIGDSWFWYTLPGGSLINQLGELVAPKSLRILALGNNGAEAFDYVNGKYSQSIQTALKLHGSSLSAVFISGGGNDFAGMKDLRPMLNADCSLAGHESECFRSGRDAGTVAWLMAKTADSYRTLIGQIRAASRPETFILMHNYDYPYPTGKGVFRNGGSWLKPALDEAKVPARLQRDCIKLVINTLSNELQALTQIDPSRVFLVNSKETLAELDWANELHPTPEGFEKIAKSAWLPILKKIGLA